MYYKMLISWTSQKVKQTYMTRNAFDFKHVRDFDRSMIHDSGPCVLFATPGMISGGFSLEVFKQWAPSEKNLITLPGYCVAGTVGHKLMSGKATRIDLDQETQIDVRCQIHQLSFSPHTDGKGIMDLVKFLSPKHVILVHGEKPKMAALKDKIQNELHIPCYDPANNETVSIPSSLYVKSNASSAFIRSTLSPNFSFRRHTSKSEPDNSQSMILEVDDVRVNEGILVAKKNQNAVVLHQDELLLGLGKGKHEIQFTYCCPVPLADMKSLDMGMISNEQELNASSAQRCLLQYLFGKLGKLSSGISIQDLGDCIMLGSMHIRVCVKDKCPNRINGDPCELGKAVFFCCAWSRVDNQLAWKVISAMKESM